LENGQNLLFRIEMWACTLISDVGETAETTVLNSGKLKWTVPNRVRLIAGNTWKLPIRAWRRKIRVAI
jgi:Mn2+/Fe2+ NRAMP family transporter